MSPCPPVRHLPGDTAAPGVALRGSAGYGAREERCSTPAALPPASGPRRCRSARSTQVRRGRQGARPPPLRARPPAGRRLLPWAAGLRTAPRPSRHHPPAVRPASGSRPCLSAPRPAPPSPTRCRALAAVATALVYPFLAFLNASPGSAGNVGTHVGHTPLRLTGSTGFLVVPSPEGAGTRRGWGPGAAGADARSGLGVAVGAARSGAGTRRGRCSCGGTAQPETRLLLHVGFKELREGKSTDGREGGVEREQWLGSGARNLQR